MSTPTPIKVKKLEFEQIEPGYIIAMTALGLYEIEQHETKIQMTFCDIDLIHQAKTITQAKEIAQTDFENRVLGCIEIEP